jgi:DNA-binding beta-propeller fold protein YncE
MIRVDHPTSEFVATGTPTAPKRSAGRDAADSLEAAAPRRGGVPSLRGLFKAGFCGLAGTTLHQTGVLAAPVAGASLAPRAVTHFSGRNVYVAAGTGAHGEGILTYIDGWTDTANATLALPASRSAGLSFTPDARHLYVATGVSGDCDNLFVFNTVPSQPTYQQAVGQVRTEVRKAGTQLRGAQSVFVNPRTERAYFADSHGAIGVVDLRPGSKTENEVVGAIRAHAPGMIGQAAFTPDGKALWWPERVGAGQAARIAIINTDPKSRSFHRVDELKLQPGFDPGGIAMNANGTRAYVSSRAFNVVRVFDVAKRRAIADMHGGTGGGPGPLAVAASSGKVYVATGTDTSPASYLRVYNGDTRDFVGELQLSSNFPVGALQLSYDESQVYIGGSRAGSAVKVVDVTGGAPANLPAISLPEGGTPAALAVQGTPKTILMTLIAEIGSLVQDQKLSQAQADPLSNPLQQVLESVLHGHGHDPRSFLLKFQTGVKQYRDQGILSQARALQLLDALDILLTQF